MNISAVVMMTKTLGQRLKERRLAMQLTVKQAAEMLNMTERGYRYLEADEKRPSIDTAVKIEEHFGIPVREMTLHR